MKTNEEKSAAPERVRATPYRTRDRALCPLCEKPVKLMTFSESAEFFKTETAEIEYLANSGKLHRIHNNRGKVMICAESLFYIFDASPTQVLPHKTPADDGSRA